MSNSKESSSESELNRRTEQSLSAEWSYAPRKSVDASTPASPTQRRKSLQSTAPELQRRKSKVESLPRVYSGVISHSEDALHPKVLVSLPPDFSSFSEEDRRQLHARIYSMPSTPELSVSRRHSRVATEPSKVDESSFMKIMGVDPELEDDIFPQDVVASIDEEKELESELANVKLDETDLTDIQDISFEDLLESTLQDAKNDLQHTGSIVDLTQLMQDEVHSRRGAIKTVPKILVTTPSRPSTQGSDTRQIFQKVKKKLAMASMLTRALKTQQPRIDELKEFAIEGKQAEFHFREIFVPSTGRYMEESEFFRNVRNVYCLMKGIHDERRSIVNLAT
ncbi:hypothetical protein EDD86DRAFT_218198 [Gorgonomyces haynaldii]|nr:hypothetical protein EDD86DRAFT_218198 [Gorgonomyces haynaldii]